MEGGAGVEPRTWCVLSTCSNHWTCPPLRTVMMMVTNLSSSGADATTARHVSLAASAQVTVLVKKSGQRAPCCTVGRALNCQMLHSWCFISSLSPHGNPVTQGLTFPLQVRKSTPRHCFSPVRLLENLCGNTTVFLLPRRDEHTCFFNVLGLEELR